MSIELTDFSALIDKRSLFLFIIAVVSFLLGLLFTYTIGESSWIVFPEGTPIIVVSIIVFTAGFLFFGYLSPLIMFLTGSYAGHLYLFVGSSLTEPVVISAASLLICYSSIRLGDSLLKDMAGRSNFRMVLRVSLALLVTGIVLSLIGDFIVRPELFGI